MQVAIIGYGNMGKTYARSFIHSRFIKADDIFIFRKENANHETDTEIPSQNFYNGLHEKIAQVDIVIMAVKPQDFEELAQNLCGFLTPNQLILSVMAGVTISKLQSSLKVAKIIRSMPNIPTQVGMGLTVFSASNDVDRKEVFIIQNLINTTGKSIYVENESLIDGATAVSGSGPAYVFYFMNAMIKAGLELGFTQSEAELLVNQTFLGSVYLQQGNSLSNEEWIAKVASKGGTTEAALTVFNQSEIEKNIINGVKKANFRAIELGN